MVLRADFRPRTLVSVVLNCREAAGGDVSDALECLGVVARIPGILRFLELAADDENPLRHGVRVAGVLKVLDFPDAGNVFDGLLLGYHGEKAEPVTPPDAARRSLRC